jgi:hypothetical protein
VNDFPDELKTIGGGEEKSGPDTPGAALIISDNADFLLSSEVSRKNGFSL